MDSLSSLLHQAVAHHRAGEVETAQAMYRYLLANTPDDSDALHLLAVSQQDTSTVEHGLTLLKRALALAPALSLYQHSRGVMAQAGLAALRHWMDAGEPARAAAVGRLVLMITPDDLNALRLTGMAEIAIGNPAGVDHYAHALLHHDGREDLVQELHGAVASVLDDDAISDPAKAAIENALDMARASLTEYGHLLVLAGHPQEASRAVRGLHYTRPEDAGPRHVLALSAWQQNLTDFADELFETGLRCDPNHSGLLTDYGRYLWNRGKIGEAAQTFRRALTITPDDTRLQTLLTAAITALGGPNQQQYHPPKTCQIEALAQIYRAVFGYRTDGTFLEIGAFDGETFSNTCFLADIGWRGIYVEPVPRHADMTARRHRYNRVEVVRAAVGAADGTAEISVAGPLSSLDDNHIERFAEISWSKGAHTGDFVEVPMLATPTLISRLGLAECDVLIIDVEGFEWPIVKAWPFDQLKPRLAIIESRDLSPEFGETACADSRAVITRFLENGYSLYWRNHENIVFLRQY